MNVLSLNVQGMGKKKKRRWISDLSGKHKVNFLALQETKTEHITDFDVKSVWGNFNYEYVFSPAIGLSGGVLCVWDPQVFVKSRSITTRSFVAIEGDCVSKGVRLMFIVVYAPNDCRFRKLLWLRLKSLIRGWEGEVVLVGDFNEVRYAFERSGSLFNSASAALFNDFIVQLDLIDVYLGGYSFTWTDKWAKKMSKLDRFLVSRGMFTHFPDLSGLVLDRFLSDHRPILLFENHVDYGPTPFRLFHSWLEDEDFACVVSTSWKEAVSPSNNPIVDFFNKLKRLKGVLRVWCRDQLNMKHKDRLHCLEKIKHIDKKIDEGSVLEEELRERVELFKNVLDMDSKIDEDNKQRAKVKWAVDGDENSGFFHGVVNKKRRQKTVHGVMRNGDWISEPVKVKDAFFNHFKSWFSSTHSQKPTFDSEMFHVLSREQANTLDSMVTNEEIKQAVWDCGVNKAPGPDGFTVEFFKKLWDLVHVDLFASIKHFFEKGKMPSGCNSSFIALIPKVKNPRFLNEFRPISLIGFHYKVIGKLLANRLANVINDLISQEQSAFVLGRQILDGPMILNEVVSWCIGRKKKMMLLKVDFEKAYDSLRWDYLEEIMSKMGFGRRWCKWIRACLVTSRASVLVNGSPTDEFACQRGLRQGDPLSPFLFIIAMEGLHVAFNRAVTNKKFIGFRVGDSPFVLSNLFYADDAMFLGEWSTENVRNILYILHCFYLISGLKINVNKSKLFGVGVDLNISKEMASRFGCVHGIFPFIHLGVPVGRNMSTVVSWNEVVEKFHARLNRWKVKALSIGGRLTLLKSVLGSLATYYLSVFKAPLQVLKKLETLRNRFFIGGSDKQDKITWVAWNKVLRSKDNGGLGVGSLFALNRALLYKWKWKFLTVRRNLWVHTIKAIYGDDGDTSMVRKSGNWNTCWKGVQNAITHLRNNDIDLDYFLKKKVGDGSNTFFWKERWNGEDIFMLKYPRIYNLQLNKDITVKELYPLLEANLRRRPRSGVEQAQWDQLVNVCNGVHLGSVKDSWQWDLGLQNDFTVATTREFIDDLWLGQGNVTYKWNKCIPIKINIFAWRLSLNRLPTKDLLAIRGINIQDLTCLNCGENMESINHIFYSCPMAVDLWSLCGRWCDIDFPQMFSWNEWSTWLRDLQVPAPKKEILCAICLVLKWSIWRFRNEMSFSVKKPKKGDFFHNFVISSFLWITHRYRKDSFVWAKWLCNPFL